MCVRCVCHVCVGCKLWADQVASMQAKDIIIINIQFSSVAAFEPQKLG